MSYLRAGVAGLGDFGFGQTDVNALLGGSEGLPICGNDAGWWATLIGNCLPNQTEAEGAAGSQCNWFENLLMPGTCASAQSAAPLPSSALTLPPQPVTTISNSCPSGTSLSDGTCMQSGVDQNGNPIFVSVPNAQQQQQINVQAITNQVAQQAPPDCSQWFNNFFNPACGCTYCENVLTWGAIGLIALVALKVGKVI